MTSNCDYDKEVFMDIVLSSILIIVWKTVHSLVLCLWHTFVENMIYEQTNFRVVGQKCSVVLFSSFMHIYADKSLVCHIYCTAASNKIMPWDTCTKGYCEASQGRCALCYGPHMSFYIYKNFLYIGDVS